MVAAALPVSIEPTEQPSEEGWWVETTVDVNQNGIGDMVEKFNDHPLFLDADNTLPIIVDFDHTPTPSDVAMLEREVGYVHAWDLPLIDAVAGRLPHDMIRDSRFDWRMFNARQRRNRLSLGSMTSSSHPFRAAT